MAENAKQEIEITFGGRPYMLRPTFEVLASVEQATGQASIVLAREIYGTRAPVGTIAIILYNVLRPQGGPKLEEIGEILVEDGYADLLEPLGDLLARALKGNAAHMREAALAGKKVDPQKQD